MTTLILMRHGKAEEEKIDGEWISVLTEEGRKTTEVISEYLLQKEYLVQHLYCSPLLRAKQTAAIVATKNHIHATVDDRLEFADDETLIEAIHPGKTVMLIGHEPTLIDFGRRLCGKNILPAGLPKSGCAILHFDEQIAYGSGLLREFINPATIPGI